MLQKLPDPVDVHVGSRVRMRRILLGMSQEKLGEELGLTFQQIQKYEKGTNRISASRLFHISRILNVPVQFFFDELAVGSEDAMGPGGLGGINGPDHVEFARDVEGLQLNKAFAAIDDPAVRRKIVDLLKSLASRKPADGTDG